MLLKVLKDFHTIYTFHLILLVLKIILGDRCISVINPGKVESRSADSWRGLVARIRHLLLVSYAKAVSRLEDHVRQQRERRNEIGWDFMQYFQLQVKWLLTILIS